MIEKAAARRSRWTDEGRVEALVDALEPRLKRAFQTALREMRGSLDMKKLEELLRTGRVEEALDEVLKKAATLGNEAAASVIRAGQSAATFLSRALEVTVVFDQVNEYAVRAIRQNRLDLIRGFSAQQRAATRMALSDGIERGLNPRQQALLFRDTLGLTPMQEESVQNFRRLLQEGSSDALERQLRDRRYDASIRRAIGGEALDDATIERMVDRYRQRAINMRATTIARTEALRAAHEGSQAMFDQAIEDGTIEADQLEETWRVRRDGRERRWHGSMTGQKRNKDGYFVSGRGNRLRYPGDPAAPGVEVINCRCAVVTRLRKPGDDE